MIKKAGRVIELQEALPSDLSRIEGLMQFHLYELSEWQPITFWDTGMYRLGSKHKYWKGDGVFPFLIRVDGELAGFAVVDNRVVYPDTQYNLGYFFVGRRYRDSGAGEAVAKDLFKRFKGPWEIQHSSKDEAARAFWNRAIKAAKAKELTISEQLVADELCTHHRFST